MICAKFEENRTTFRGGTSGLKMLKMLKNLNFQNDGRKVIYSLKRSPRRVEEEYIIIYLVLWLKILQNSLNRLKMSISENMVIF